MNLERQQMTFMDMPNNTVAIEAKCKRNVTDSCPKLETQTNSCAPNKLKSEMK